MVSQLHRLHPEWTYHGKPWLPWVCVDTHDPVVADDVYKVASESGCPITHAGLEYNMSTFLRIAVRRPCDFTWLFQVLLKRHFLASFGSVAAFGRTPDFPDGIVVSVRFEHVDELLMYRPWCVEDTPVEEGTPTQMPLPTIIVDSQHNIVLKGHGQLSLFRGWGLSVFPIVAVNYLHPSIVVRSVGLNETNKESVISAAISGHPLPAMTAEHMVRTTSGALEPLEVIAQQIDKLFACD